MHDRFLSAPSRTPQGAPLGRHFSVTRQTWALTDDPRSDKPATTTLASGRSAAEAADIARNAATGFAAHGFHKPSGAWWASEGARFHRYLIASDRRRNPASLWFGLGAAALALVAVRKLVRPRDPRA